MNYNIVDGSNVAFFWQSKNNGSAIADGTID